MKKYKLSLVLTFAVALTACSKKTETAPVNTNVTAVSTYAGTGENGTGDGKASEAKFGGLGGIAIDVSGNLYVTDNRVDAVRKISSNGIVTTIADNGQAATGTFGTHYSVPTGVAVDNAKNVFVGYLSSAVVRKIAPDGTGTVIAGSQLGGFKPGIGVNAGIGQPYQIAIDANDNIYLAAGAAIFKISPTTLVTVLAGSDGTSTIIGGDLGLMNYATGIAIGPNGDIYVADSGHNMIKKIAANGTISIVAGTGTRGRTDGPAATATFNFPQGLAVDATGNIYVADANNNLIRKISTSGIVSTLAGTGQQGAIDGSLASASFADPTALAIDSKGNLYVADSGNYKIRKIILNQ